MADPEQLVEVRARVPYRLRAKVHAYAAAQNMSAAAYLEQVLEQLPPPTDRQAVLPLAQSA